MRQLNAALFLYKQIYKPNSVLTNESLSFIYVCCYQHTLAAYPPTSSVPLSPDSYRDAGLHDIAPHRVYLVSLQLNLYILSVALFLISRLVAVNHYVALWCSDFPPRYKRGDKAICLYAKVHKLLITRLKYRVDNS